jgi:hypothetical protein
VFFFLLTKKTRISGTQFLHSPKETTKLTSSPHQQGNWDDWWRGAGFFGESASKLFCEFLRFL